MTDTERGQTDAFTIREFQSGDEEGLVDLFVHAFGESHDRAYWEWKYRGNPAGFFPPIVAEADGEIIGHHGYVPSRFRYFGETMAGAIPADVAIREDHRVAGSNRRGILFGMHELATRVTRARCQFLYSIPIPKFYAFAKRMFKEEDLFRLVPLQFDLAGAGAPGDTGPWRLAATRDEERDEAFELAGAWNEIGPPIRIVRDADFLRWRYGATPGDPYETLLLRSDGRPLAFAATKTVDEGPVRVTYVVDYALADDSDDLRRVFFTMMIGEAKLAGAGAIKCWALESSPLFPTLTSLGFLDHGTHVHVLQRMYDERVTADRFLDPENWFFSMGYADGI